MNKIVLLSLSAAFMLAASLSFAACSPNDQVLGSGHSEKAFNIPSMSMMPTILPGDVVMAKLIADIEDKKFIEAGVIVVFSNPVDGYQQVGRIIATGGQTVRMSGGVVNIDGVPLRQDAVGKYELSLDRIVDAALLREFLGARSYEILDVQHEFGPLDNTSSYEVPDNHYFILGDNRDMSMDSRVKSKVGYVPAENIIGEAMYIRSSKSNSDRKGKRLDD